MEERSTRDGRTLWPAAPHTLAKHRVYRQYLSKWMPIMLYGFGGNITYAEGFSGPGVYTGGEPGSPVIAMRSIIDDPSLRMSAKDLRFLFVEKDQARANELKVQLQKVCNPVALERLLDYGIDLEVRTGDCDPVLIELLTDHRAWGHPMLVVLDTFGGSVNLDIVRRIALNPSSEVIITFEPHYFARFASSDTVTHGDSVFGDPDWRKVSELDEKQKASWLVGKYRSLLKQLGFEYVLTFELATIRGHSLFLIFGTNHDRGLQKMKEAMWEVDPVTGVQYRDPADPAQELLDIQLEPHTVPLRRIMVKYLQAEQECQVSVASLRNYALRETVYKASHVKPELDILAQQGIIVGDGAQGQVRLGGAVRLTPKMSQ